MHAEDVRVHGQTQAQLPGAANDTLLRIGDAAESLGLSRSKLYELIGDGRIRVLKIDRAVRIRRSEILRFIDSLDSRGAGM